jgi:trans-aconitate methyltransferase
MSLADEYRRQQAWRTPLYDHLPPLAGRTVLDLGCAIGDQSAVLAERGARVIGIDGNDELLEVARARGVAEVHKADLRAVPDVKADGIWASFVAAYFVDFAPVLAHWAQHLRPGGWIALVEIDDLFGHEPLAPQSKTLLDDYAREALVAQRYDFHMGHKLPDFLSSSGFTIVREHAVADAELSFDGPARPDVIQAWRDRFDRMQLLCARPGFEVMRDDFLACLARADHRSVAKVCFCLATR